MLADLGGTLEAFGGGRPGISEGGVTYAPGLQANGTVNSGSSDGGARRRRRADGGAGARCLRRGGQPCLGLAEVGHEVLAVEGDGRALQGLKQRAEAAALNLRAQPLDLFSELPLKLGQFETVVLDPPRAGADHLCKGLAALRKGRRSEAHCLRVLRAAHLGAGCGHAPGRGLCPAPRGGL